MSDQPLNDGSNGPSNKRKREAMDAPDGQRMTRSSHGPGSNGNNMQGSHIPTTEMSQAARLIASPDYTVGYEHGLPGNPTELSQIDQQLLQHVGNQNGMSDDNAMTAKAALAAQSPQSKYPPPDSAFDANSSLGHGLTFGEEINQAAMGGVPGHNSSTAAAVYAAREAQSMNPRPTVGTPEWHQLRKNNHKEVERRRRETINEGINEIAKMVPGCEKAKGSILQRAIQYITKLQDDAKDMAARWDTVNMTTNHAIQEISGHNAKLKGEVNRRGDIALKWIQRCRDAGLEFGDYDDEKDLGQLEIEEPHE